MAGNSILAKMAVQITAQNADFARAMSKSQRDLAGFTNGVTKIAGALGAAFGIQQIADFTVHVAKLSGEAKAVRAAFERLPESTKLMRDLQQATGGTVSELSLMKRAVQASNFDISLKALPRLLEFATLRAQQTGQSVDYLVDSIVTGIGRKSKLILDNLGISAVQLTEALGGASAASSSIGDVAEAVGKIAEENLKNMETFSENASTKLQRLAASWENLKVAIGDSANSTGVLGRSVDALSGSMDLLASRQLDFWEKLVAVGGGPGAAAAAILEDIKRKQEQINREQKKQENIIKQVDKAFVKFKGNIDEFAKAISPTHPLRGEFLKEFEKRLVETTKEQVITLGELRDAEKELNDLFSQTDVNDKKKLQNTANEILSIREKIKAIEDLLKVEKEAAALSITAQRALAGTSVTGVSSISGIGTSIPIDTNTMFSKMEEFRNKNAEVTAQVSEDWVNMSGSIAGALSSIAEGIGASSVGVEDFGSSIIRAFAGFAKEFGEMLIATGVAGLALGKVLANPLALTTGGAIGLIAAGTALVGTAGAASAALSQSFSGSRGGGSGFIGITPSQANDSRSDFRVRGYDLASVGSKDSYRRSRVG